MNNYIENQFNNEIKILFKKIRNLKNIKNKLGYHK